MKLSSHTSSEPQRDLLRVAIHGTLLFVVASTMVVSKVRAEPASPSVLVESVGECPTRDAVSSALTPLLGRRGPTQAVAGSLRVANLGDRFQVTAAGQTAEYVDAARDCSERARVAAVFMALALNPPAFQSPSTPNHVTDGQAPLAPTAPVEPSATPKTTEAGTWMYAALGARIDGRAGSGDHADPVTIFGADLRTGMGWGSFGAALGIGATTPTVTKFAAIPVHEQRFPMSVTATARWAHLGAFELSSDLGIALAVLRLRADGLGGATTATRLDVGVRALVGVRGPVVAARWAGLAPFFSVHAEYFPRPYELDVAPLGRIGSTSHLWVGASAGLCFEAP